MTNNKFDELKILLRNLEEKKGELSSEEYESMKGKYTKRLEALQTQSTGEFFTEVTISGSGKITRDFISINGSGRVEGWHGGTVKISGSAKITPNELKISGTGKIPGNIITKQLRSSGTLEVNGSLGLDQGNSSGSLKIQGPFVAKNFFQSSGSLEVEGSINGGDLELSGATKVTDSISGRNIDISGTFKIQGDVNCTEDFEAELSGESFIQGTLTAANITVEASKRRAELTIDHIVAKGAVYLENVTVKTVTAKEVELGDNCNVGEIKKLI